MAQVVFVHGLDNKPEADYLFNLWKRKLAFEDGLDLDACGVSASMNYWADVLYESPDMNLAGYESAAGTIEGIYATPELNSLDHKDDERIRGLARKLDVDPDVVEEIQPTEAEMVAVQLECAGSRVASETHHGALCPGRTPLFLQYGVHAAAWRILSRA